MLKLDVTSMVADPKTTRAGFVSAGPALWHTGPGVVRLNPGPSLGAYFDRGCATSFVLGHGTGVAPPWFTQIDEVASCVRQRLEAVSFRCAGDFVRGIGGGGWIPLLGVPGGP